jgi:xanthine dehydrogenase accessory factor
VSGDWIASLAAHAREGRAAVLVTILSASGSTPREAGCKMVVTEVGATGTIGGGQLEWRAIETARQLLADPTRPAPVVLDLPLGPGLGQCCGGAVGLLFERVLPPARQIALFGAGHVGRAVARLLGELPCRLTWIDSRADAFPPGNPANTVTLASALPVHEVASLAEASAVLVMTHDHQLDLELVEAALRRPFRFVGLIGSATKRARFEKRLAQRGLGQAAIDRLVCPIGLPGIGSKHPAEIAVAVVAQLLALPEAIPAAATAEASRSA